jgi:hypothetical protein
LQSVPDEFAIVDVFEISGRGAVVLVESVTGRGVRTRNEVELIKPTGEVIATQAFTELICDRDPKRLRRKRSFSKACTRVTSRRDRGYASLNDAATWHFAGARA